MIDEYFIRCAQSGDKKALDKLVRRYYDKIYSYCCYHLKDKQWAADICQETFCSVLEHLEEYRHYDKFQNYLYVIAGNKCKDFYKKKTPLYMGDIPENNIFGDGLGHGGFENEVTMRQLVHNLPEELEAVIILRFYQELKYHDMADILQISVSLVKYRVKKAIALLRAELERNEA